MQIALRCIVAGITLLFLGTVVQAQTLIGGKIQLFSSGATSHTLIITPPVLSGNVTYTLPTSSGTLLVNSGSGVSNAWLLGGNDLSGPADNRIGSTTAHDVVLIAGTGAAPANDRLTILSGTNAITNHDGGELRFAEPTAGGSNYSAFKAGTQGNDITYTLPAATPGTNDVLTATAVSGNDVTLGWAAPSGGGGLTPVTVEKSSNQIFSNNGYANVTDLGFTMKPGKFYKFTIVLEMTKNNVGGNAVEGQLEWGGTPNTSVLNYVTSLGETGTRTTDNQDIAYIPSAGQQTVTERITGIIMYSGTANSNFQLRMRRSAAGGGGANSRNLVINATNSYITYYEL